MNILDSEGRQRWKWRASESRSVVSDSLQAHGLYSPWNSPGQNSEVGSLSLLQGIFPNQGLNPGPHIAGEFFTSWATRKPNNTGVGSLSLFQWIFPTQESNPGLLPCRQILYQLSYQEVLLLYSCLYYVSSVDCFLFFHWWDLDTF